MKKMFIVFIVLLLLSAIRIGLQLHKDEKELIRSYTKEEKKELALEYMKEKYKEEFVGVSYGMAGASIFNTIDHFKVYPKRLTENDLIYITGKYNDKGEYVFSDSYFEILIEDRYREYVKNLLDEIYPEHFLKINGKKAVFGERTYSDRLTKDTPINEIHGSDETFFSPSIYVYIAESQLNQKSIAEHAHIIANKFLEHNLHCDVRLHAVKQEKYAEFSAKGGRIYPDAFENFTGSWTGEELDLKKKMAEEFFMKEGKMQREFYNLIIGIETEGEELEIRKGLFNKD